MVTEYIILRTALACRFKVKAFTMDEFKQSNENKLKESWPSKLFILYMILYANLTAYNTITPFEYYAT